MFFLFLMGLKQMLNGRYVCFRKLANYGPVVGADREILKAQVIFVRTLTRPVDTLYTFFLAASPLV